MGGWAAGPSGVLGYSNLLMEFLRRPAPRLIQPPPPGNLVPGSHRQWGSQDPNALPLEDQLGMKELPAFLDAETEAISDPSALPRHPNS